MHAVSIKLAKITDAAELQQVFVAAYAHFQTRIRDLPDVSSGLAEDIANHKVWVATVGAQIVGGAVLFQDQNAFHLANIAVHPDRHGSGIGRKLISTVEAYVAKAGGVELHLATHIDMPENVAIYLRLGWVETGRQGNKVFMKKAIVGERG